VKRLRHPIRAIREPFGTAGLIIACVALVAALGGTALAAAKLNSTQKKEVEKIAKKFAGKPGAAGANGTNGTNGTAGAKGENGGAGAAGAKGENGVSVTTVAIPKTPSKCSNQGGVEVKSASAPLPVCNGTTGFTETLPTGKMETGTWAAQSVTGNTEVFVPISFTIPIEGAEVITKKFFLKNGGGEVCSVLSEPAKKECEERVKECPGSTNAPEAEPGSLCVYSGEATSGIEALLIGKASSGFSGPIGGPGAMMLAVFEAGGFSASGSWAVTAP
jgi:hypothetical protein